MSVKFSLTTPCDQCPFGLHHNAVKGLREDRLRSILDAGDQTMFTCHKTIEYGDDDEYRVRSGQECAGFMIYKMANNEPTFMMRLAANFNKDGNGISEEGWDKLQAHADDGDVSMTDIDDIITAHQGR